MPISAEQWRVKTGMINASRGFRQHSIKPPSLCEFPLTPPPSDWKGYNPALTLLCLPLLYKTYTLGATVIMHLVRGEFHYHQNEWINYDSYVNNLLHQQSYVPLLGLLLSGAFYLVMMMTALIMGVCEYRERDKHQWRLIQPLHQLKFVWFDSVTTAGTENSLQVVPKMVTGCVHVAFVMGRQDTLQHVPTSVKKVKSNSTCQTVTIFVSFILQLSTIALAILLLQAGDVERNPRPSLSEEHIKTLVNELKPVMSKYHGIGLQLGIQAAQIEVIEKDHPFTERRLTEVLLFWLRGNTDVPTCWESIIDALIHVDRRQLAEELAEKYCDKTKLGLLSERSVQATPAVQEHGDRILLPVFDTSLLDDSQKQRLRMLSADMDKLVTKFQDLIDSISSSLKEREIPISEIVAKIIAFQAFEPVYASPDSRPILKHRMSDLESAKTVYEVMIIISTYSSFFNYHLVERIIKSLGTDEDRKQLSQYEEEYKCFAECTVYECPTKFQGPVDTKTQREFMVKVDDTFERCTLSHLKRFINKLSEVLNLSKGTLLLESIRRGCLELTLQSPLFVYERIFPLSSDQESALAALGVIKISAGDYQYPHHSQDEPDSDDNDDKPDDGSGPGGGRGESGIDTLTTIFSELSELSEEISTDYFDPYDIDHDFGQSELEVAKHGKEVTPLHVAAYHGHLDYVQVLLDSGMYSLSQRDKLGYTAVHQAVRGCHFDVLRYFIEEHECNPSDFGAFGETPLHLACGRGNLEIVKYLVLDQRVDPMCEDEEYGVTPLHAACIGGNIDIVRLLVSEMSAYNTIEEITDERTRFNIAPPHMAALYGHLVIVEYFFSELKCNPNVRGRHEKTCLHCAAQKGYLDIVTYLIDTMNCDPLVLDDRKRTPFFYSAESKSLETVRILSKYEEDLNSMCRDIDGDTPLHMSALAGEIEVVKYFISELNYEPNVRNKDGKTPLHAAAQEGHLQVMRYLIDEKKCDPSVEDCNGATPLYVAAICGHLNVVKFLAIQKHCNPLLKTSRGNIPLHISAATYGHIDIVKFFVTELKCDPNVPGPEGSTSLHFAARYGHMEVMKFLINECKCPCSLRNYFGETPLHVAARGGHVQVIKYLVTDEKCDPSLVDDSKSAPLHYAAQMGHLEAVKFLTTDLECDPGCRNHDGYTPLHLAACNGHEEVVKFLISELKCNPTVINKKGKTHHQL